MKRVNIQIFGRVQGVGFRFFTMQRAKGLNIVGWVTNRSDGSVEIEAQGAEEDINKFIQWCKEGPPSSKVEDIKVKEIETQEKEKERFSVK